MRIMIPLSVPPILRLLICDQRVTCCLPNQAEPIIDFDPPDFRRLRPVDLSAPRAPGAAGAARAACHGPGRPAVGRAGRFVQLRKER